MNIHINHSKIYLMMFKTRAKGILIQVRLNITTLKLYFDTTVYQLKAKKVRFFLLILQLCLPSKNVK